MNSKSNLSYLIRDRLFLAWQTLFLITTVSCVNLWFSQYILEWANSYDLAYLEIENCSVCAMHKLVLLEIISHGHKKNVNKWWSYKAHMAESFISNSLNLATFVYCIVLYWTKTILSTYFSNKIDAYTLLVVIAIDLIVYWMETNGKDQTTLFSKALCRG